MQTSSCVFVGLDTSKLKISVALAEEGRLGEVRFLGDIDSSPDSVRRLIVSATNSPLLWALTERQQRFFSELLLCPLRHKIGSDIDECFGDLSSILAGRFPFCLAELADGRDDIASDGMTSKDGLPKLGRVPCS